jgi:tryptophanyl-tRNA synthetase
MSLRDGSKKMSKSDPSDYSRIHLLDTDDDICLKIKKAKTDSLPIPLDPALLATRSEALNLLQIYAAFADKTLQDVCQFFEGKDFSYLKKHLIDILIEKISPIRFSMKQLLLDKEYLISILTEGQKYPNDLAKIKLDKIREALSLL